MKRATAAFAMVMLVGSSAHAHPAIDEAIERIDVADFDGALEAFARAEETSDLRRADLATIFARRAAVHFALSNEIAAREDLARLAAAEPNYVFAVWAPPTVREAFEQVRSGARQVELRTEVENQDAQVVLHAGVSGDPGGLVREIVFSTRETGNRDWTRSPGSVVHLQEGAYEYFAEAIAAGGVVIARDGRSGSPLRAGEPASVRVDLAAAGDTDDDDEEGSSLYWWIGGIAAVAAVALVTTAVLVATTGTDGGQTVVGAPMVTFR